MKEERMTILRMVAEGKINAEEAEMLLEALGGPDKPDRQRVRTRRMKRRGRNDFAWGMGDFAHTITQGVVGAVHDAVGNAFDSFEKEFEFFDEEFDSTPEIVAISPGTTLAIETNSGALTLFGSDEPHLKVSGSLKRHFKIKQHEDKIAIKANRFGVALTIHIPRSVERLLVKTNLGEILARNFTNDLKDAQFETHTGNIGLDIGTITEGRFLLKSHTGMIKLILSPRSACSIKASATHMGEIETNLPLEISERGPGYLVGVLNGGGAMIGLATHTGEIFIESARPTSSTQPASPPSPEPPQPPESSESPTPPAPPNS